VQPFSEIEIGMTNDVIPLEYCQRMGIPAGSLWGANAGEARRAQMQGMVHAPR
jgi:hypothetical protein